MTRDEALLMAIEAIENADYHNDLQAIAVIKDIMANVASNDTSQERVDKTSESVHEPWSPVSIGVDITKEGAHVVGIYALDKDTSQVFYAKYYPVPQRTWVGLTPQERDEINEKVYGAVPHHVAFHAAIEQALREKNT